MNLNSENIYGLLKAAGLLDNISNYARGAVSDAYNAGKSSIKALGARGIQAGTGLMAKGLSSIGTPLTSAVANDLGQQSYAARQAADRRVQDSGRLQTRVAARLLNPTKALAPQSSQQAYLNQVAPPAAPAAAQAPAAPQQSSTQFRPSWWMSAANRALNPAPAAPERPLADLNTGSVDALRQKLLGATQAPAATPQAPAPSGAMSLPVSTPYQPQAVPTPAQGIQRYSSSSITPAMMQQYRRYTGATDMNSDMDRWKTFQAMLGNMNASNEDYYRARRSGFAS